MQEAITIHEFAVKMTAELRRVGYAESTLYRHLIPDMMRVVHYYEKAGITYYSIQATTLYLSLQKERLDRQEITEHYYRQVKSIASRMNDFFITGEIKIPSAKRGTVYVISPEYENLVDRFVDYKQYKQNTCDDVRWVVRKYLFFLEQKGHSSLDTVSIEDARTFILETAADVTSSSLHSILLYLKHFHIFLKETGIPAPDCVELFSYKVYREMPVLSYVTDEELSRIFAVIDRTTEMGKRDYAIIQLAATTGLRACDIIRLRLKDIDWRKGEIYVNQKKTGRDVTLPLLNDAAEALKDYILNARPESDDNTVFLRISAPHKPVSNAVSIGEMFKRYQNKAGLQRQTLDGKGFHGLRRRLAKKLLVSGTPTTAIAQILGHDDINSVRQYLSLNTENIRECALDFDGIEVVRKELM